MDSGSGVKVRDRPHGLPNVSAQGTVDAVVGGLFHEMSAPPGDAGGYEKGRVLQALLKRTDVPSDVLVDALNEAGKIGGYEASQVLQVAARNQDITGPARETYVRVADSLSQHEQGQALAALVRNERRK